MVHDRRETDETAQAATSLKNNSSRHDFPIFQAVCSKVKYFHDAWHPDEQRQFSEQEVVDRFYQYTSNGTDTEIRSQIKGRN